MEETRTCRLCGIDQPIEEYYRHSRGKPGRLHRCRTCTKAASRRWRDENRERFTQLRWARDLRMKYGITVDDYRRMYSEQGGLCAGCRTTNPGRHGRVFAVDHCHDTGRVRGLLCENCNISLGRMGEDGEALRNLARYADQQCRVGR